MLILPSFVLPQGPPEKRGPEYFRGKEPGFLERKGMMGPRHHSVEYWIHRLQLTEDQVTRLQEIRESYLRDTLVWRNELIIKRFDLKDLLANPQADPVQVLAKQREISNLESRIQERAVRHQLQIRQILTPEQIKLLPPWFGFHGGQRMMPGQGGGIRRE